MVPRIACFESVKRETHFCAGSGVRILDELSITRVGAVLINARRKAQIVAGRDVHEATSWPTESDRVERRNILSAGHQVRQGKHGMVVVLVAVEEPSYKDCTVTDDVDRVRCGENVC